MGGAGFGDIADGGQDCDPMCRGARGAVRGDTEVERLSVVDDIRHTSLPAACRARFRT